MSRIKIVVPVLLAVILAASAACILLLLDTEKKADKHIAAIHASASGGSHDECAAQLIGFEEFWQERENVYLLFVRHEELHNIEISIKQMQAYCGCENKSGVISELAMLDAVLKHISESEMPTLVNIL